MSLAPSPIPVSAIENTVSWQRFQKACVLTLGAVLFGCLIYAVEKYPFQPRHRFMESPAEVMMRALGFAHFLIGWMFLLTSSRWRSPTASLRLLAATLAGVATCAAFGLLGSVKEPLVLIGFYAIFLVHEVQDECGLARASGDIPPDSDFAAAMAWFVTLLLLVLLAGSYLLRGLIREPESFAGWSGLGFLGLWSAFALATLVMFWRMLQIGRREHESFHAALESHLPLVRIYQALIAILLFGSMLGSVGLNLVILLHVSVWFVFVLERPEQHSREGQGIWHWLRYSKPGFIVLHVGLALLFLSLMAVRVHVWLRGGWISAILSSSAFPYWSLMHICMAFGVRK